MPFGSPLLTIQKVRIHILNMEKTATEIVVADVED